jgi:hypothetical protein
MLKRRTTGIVLQYMENMQFRTLESSDPVTNADVELKMNCILQVDMSILRMSGISCCQQTKRR